MLEVIWLKGKLIEAIVVVPEQQLEPSILFAMGIVKVEHTEDQSEAATLMVAKARVATLAEASAGVAILIVDLQTATILSAESTPTRMEIWYDRCVNYKRAYFQKELGSFVVVFLRS